MPAPKLFTTLRERGSIRTTVWSSALSAQTACSPTEIAVGVVPTGIVATMRPSCGSTASTESWSGTVAFADARP
jgi:hypothetical protein